MLKRLQIDGHVHVYPMFDVERMIGCSLANFRNNQCREGGGEEPVRIWLLTERQDCSFFSTALEYESAVYRFLPSAEAESLMVFDRRSDAPMLWIAAGRQYVTRERVEICALLCRFSAADGLYDAKDAVHAVRQAGGIASVNWAPGKWWGSRGRVVEQLLRDFSPSELLISDTTMRPLGWPKPHLMREAEKNGFRLLCGSDPLPFRGEERWAGAYSCYTEGEFNPERPADSLRKLLSSGAPLSACGKRSSPFQFALRQFSIMRENKQRIDASSIRRSMV
ncbi:MAG: hypothetical protein ONB24_10060 [candidate division KSB1 bacterium]|nr:hypothetical protein [candidate division KSB1 bacterium]